MLTATEFHMRESLPLHRIHEAIFEFCRGRSDAVAIFSIDPNSQGKPS